MMEEDYKSKNSSNNNHRSKRYDKEVQRLTFPFPFVHHQSHDWKVEQLLTLEPDVISLGIFFRLTVGNFLKIFLKDLPAVFIIVFPLVTACRIFFIISLQSFSFPSRYLLILIHLHDRVVKPLITSVLFPGFLHGSYDI